MMRRRKRGKRRRDRDTGLCREKGYPEDLKRVNKEALERCRVWFPRASARKPIQLWVEQRRTPPACSTGGVVDWIEELYSDPRLSPRACITHRQVSLRRDPQRTCDHSDKRY